MGIFRVKRNSPYLSKNNDVNNKINIMPCCVLVYVPNTKQTVTLMRKMWVRRTAELTLPYCPGFPPFCDLLNNNSTTFPSHQKSE